MRRGPGRLPRARRGDLTGYWERAGLEGAILDALVAAGYDLDALTLDQLAPVDEFHSGGKAATRRLARVADLRPGTRVLDVGGGLGGPARTLALEYGCHVTVVDLTESYVRAGAALTARLGLADRVAHRVGDARAIETQAGDFDVVWTQNSGMNIADKRQLYARFARSLGRDGVLALQEPMAGPNAPPIYPLMWARDAGTSFLESPGEMRATIERAGFRVLAWEDVTGEFAGAPTVDAIPRHAIQRLVMGDALPDIVRAGQRNREEGRIVTIQAVFRRQ